VPVQTHPSILLSFCRMASGGEITIWVQVEQRGVKRYPTDLSVSDDAIISGVIRKCLVEEHLKQTVSPSRVKVLFEGAA